MPTRSENHGRPGAGRFLFVVPPWIGHVRPTIPLGFELMERGHDVAWTGHRLPLVDLLPSSAPLIPVGEQIPAGLPEPGKVLRGPAGAKITWGDYMVPYARSMLPGLHAAIDQFAPDVVVVDQQTIAGAAVAEARGLPWVTSATSPAGLTAWEGVGKLRDWYDALMRDFMVEAGVDGERAAAVDPCKSPYLVIAYTIPEIVGTSDLPDHFALVGYRLGQQEDATPFPWDWLDEGPGPRVLVTLGTVVWPSGGRFFQVAAEALGALADGQARGVIVAPPSLVPDVPPNVLVRERVPQVPMLPHLDAVVCHGGHNTVCEALINGLPMLVAPLQNDQPMIAAAVAAAGAGRRVRFFRETATTLRQALDEVLAEPGYREAARRMGSRLQDAGGPAAAADRLEAFLGAVMVNTAGLSSHSGQ